MIRLIVFFFRRYPWQSALVMLGLFCASMLQAVGVSATLPLITLATSDGQGGGESSPLEATVRAAFERIGLETTLETLVPIVALVFLLKAVVMIGAKREVGYMVARVATDMRLEVLRTLSAARWSYFTRQRPGAAANAVASEASRAAQAYLETINFVTNTIEAVVFLGLALAVSWQVTLVTVLAAGLSALSTNALVRMTDRAGKKMTLVAKSLLGRLTDALQAVKLLKATGREGLLGPILEADTHRLNRAMRRTVLSREALRAVQEPIVVWVALAIFVVSFSVLRMPVAEVGMILFLVVRSLNTINKTQRRVQIVRGEASALWSLNEMVEHARQHREDAHGGATPHLDDRLEFRSVSVRYDERDVLSSVSLEIPAGSITAIIGPSGAGKTTLVDLITGLVLPDSGEVRIDGTPLEELDLGLWRRMVGYVPQEMLMLHDTIRANVTLGDADVSDAEVERALREAGAWEFVGALPDGLDSSVGERGSLLSGGQRQRIAIARALVRRPRLLILDEATAALDPETEAAVWATVEALRGRTTVVAISHQPALTGVADRVYRIDDGSIEPVSAAKPGRAQEVA